MEVVFVAENGHKLIARDEVQATAFQNAGLTEEKAEKAKKESK